MKHPTAPTAAPAGRPVARGFTLVELLVVIGIIGLLIGLLLPALGKVIARSKSTATQGTMQEFAKACDAYFQEFGEYPSAIPDEVLYAGTNGTNGDAALPRFTATENALLALMGGSRRPTDPDYDSFGGTVYSFPAVGNVPAFVIKINVAKMGEGPFKNGRKYDAFYAPKGREFGRASGQVYGAGIDSTTDIPDLLDAWGAPIAFVKQQRSIGPLVRRGNLRGQLERAGMLGYVLSTSLGDVGLDQTDNSGELPKGSILNLAAVASASNVENGRDLTLAQLIRHPGLDAQTVPGGTDENVRALERVYSGNLRGKYLLLSPGPDGIYFGAYQVTWNDSGVTRPVRDIIKVSGADQPNGKNPDGPKIVERYDDVVVVGGS